MLSFTPSFGKKWKYLFSRKCVIRLFHLFVMSQKQDENRNTQKKKKKKKKKSHNFLIFNDKMFVHMRPLLIIFK